MADAQQGGKGLMGPVPEWLRPSVNFGLAGLGAGSGGYLLYAAIKAVSQHPEFLPLLTGDKVLIFIAVMTCFFLLDRRAKNFSDITERGVSASERNAEGIARLAEGVAKLAEKSDQDGTRMESIEAAVRFLATDVRDTLSIVKTFRPPEVVKVSDGD